MASLSQDLRYALRLLRRSPGFTAIAAMTIALGVGPTTTIFSVANSLLIRTPPGVRDPGALVTLYASYEGGARFATFSYYAFEEYRAGPSGLADLAALETFSASLSAGGPGEPELVTGMLASASYFEILGTRPALGRFFLPEEDDVPGAGQVVVLGHQLWRQRLGADSSIVGRTVTINRRAFTVIGVAEEGFQGNVAALEFGLWVPITMRESLVGLVLDRNATGITAVARLEPGRSVEQAKAALGVTTARLAQEDPESFGKLTMEVAPYSAMIEEARAPVTLFMALLLVVSGIVLLIASVNVAGMFLARATVRARELAVRLAIGAGRARLVRQLMVENMLLFVLGGGAGILIAYWATGALAAVRLPVPASMNFDFTPDLRVLGFALALALVTGIVFGLAPALQLTRRDITAALKGGRGAESRDREGSQPVVVVNQTAARQIWPGENALGKQIGDGRLTYEVVGIAADGKYQSIGERRRAMVYKAFPQAPSSLATLVVRTPAGTTGALGVVALALAFAAALLIRSMLYGLSPADPLALGGTVALLIAVGLLASYLPAARATRTDPMNALRAE